MTDVIPPAAVRPLPARETMLQSYRFVFGHPKPLAQALALPFLIEGILWLCSFVVSDSENWVSRLIWECFDLIPATIFGVAWHRYTLLGPSAGSPPIFALPERRHLRFYLYAFVISFILLFPILVIEGQKEVVEGFAEHDSSRSQIFLFLVLVVFGVLIPYIMGRLSFVLPAVSVDEMYSFSDSWRHTRRQGLRIWALILAMYFPVVIVFGAIFTILEFVFDASGQAGNTVYEVVFFLVGVVREYLPMALIVTAISLAFKTCTGWVPAEKEQSKD